MRLTAFLMHWKNKRPHGHVYRGKNRIVREPRFLDLWTLREDLERQENNMLILRHPYLTSEQSHGHMTDLRPTMNFKIINQTARNKKFNKILTWEDQLGHLRVRDRWE